MQPFFSFLSKLQTIFEGMSKSFKHLLLVFSFSSIIIGCIPNETNFEGFSRAELQRLLSNGALKRWALTSRTIDNNGIMLESCDTLRHIILAISSSSGDLDTALYINQSAVCSTQNDTLGGNWFIPIPETENTKMDTVGLSWAGGDTSLFQVREITANTLVLDIIDSDSLVEQFVAF